MILGVKIEVDCIDPQRIDQFLVTRLPELSRSRIQTLIKSGDILAQRKNIKGQATGHAAEIKSQYPSPRRKPSKHNQKISHLKYSMRIMTLLCLTKHMAWWFILQQAIQTAPWSTHYYTTARENWQPLSKHKDPVLCTVLIRTHRDASSWQKIIRRFNHWSNNSMTAPPKSATSPSCRAPLTRKRIPSSPILDAIL